ncbi:uncharacterized protein PG998_006794 [Apiospora kogelbergensis]|uniref:EGF domain-specific O-linked N-acetylglucosamine transferase n=1 Tax=Apiospora kogelbergensis TaxID=1337665 RepID=A0AAW0QGL7_9PEZI
MVSTPRPLPIPTEYGNAPRQEPYCDQRYTTRYLEMFRDGEFSYCSPNSPSKITCFHTHPNFHDGNRDSFCIVQGSNFNTSTNKFQLGCALQPDIEVPLSTLYWYWYETGPRDLLDRYFSIVTRKGESTGWGLGTIAPSTGKRTFTILVKREGSDNIFHCLHEIMSLTYTMDVLRMSRDPQTGMPRFSPEDVANTHIVILDDHDDGAYFDLWKLVSDRPIKRLAELVKDDPEWLMNPGNTVILPLAGGANPVWHPNPHHHDCLNQLREVFVRRVLDFYQMPTERPWDPTQSESAPLVLTFVNRTATRALENAHGLLSALRARYSQDGVQVQSVDFAGLAFAEQIKVARGTDVLVGVHGAGLTHALFMNSSRGAVVEMFPPGLEMDALRAIALERGLGYYRTHNTTSLGHRPWQDESLHVEEKVFADLVDHAVKSLYNRVGSFKDAE